MGQAKLRGTFEERKAQAIAAGRSRRKVMVQREAVKMAKYKRRQLAAQLAAEIIAQMLYGQYR